MPMNSADYAKASEQVLNPTPNEFLELTHFFTSIIMTSQFTNAKKFATLLSSAKCDLRKMTLIAPASQLEAVKSAIQAMWAPIQLPSN
jgi:hypothetical protein